MATRRELKNAFERYLMERINRAGAITPGQKKEVLAELRRELEEEGRLPLPNGPIKIDPQHPIIKAALSGQNIAMGEGASVKKEEALAEKMQGLPVWMKMLVLLGILLLPVILVWTVLLGGEGEVAVAPTETATLTATSTETPEISPTASPSPTPTNITPTPIIIEITPTAYAFSLTNGRAPNSNNDPASIEIAGFSYILGTGTIENGSWDPKGAEWLANSYLRRIVGLPFDPKLANAITTIQAGNVIKLRLRSGEIIKYKITEKLRVQRQQIEVLAAKTPSLAVLLYGETSPERTIVIANAVQEPQDFIIYSGGETITPTIPTLIPTSLNTVITTTKTFTNTFADLVLQVEDCQTTKQIGSLTAGEKQNLYICSITLTVTKNSPGTSYSQEFFGITDLSRIQNATDWVPEVQGPIPNALGNGQLLAGDTKKGQIVGIITTENPVLVWQQAGQRILIQLE